jgi:hypothetical protein
LPAAAGDVWLAQPVHLQAAMDHLRLHPAGLLHLAADESARLAADFCSVFGGDGLALHPLHGGFVLSGLAVAPGPPEPAAFAGARLDAVARSGAPAVRRLASETELWLHGHALNAERASRGAPSVSGLWLWGAGHALQAAPADPRSAASVYGEDPFVAGLAHLRGARFTSSPWSPVMAELTQAGEARTMIQVSAARRWDAREPVLARIDRELVAPLMAQVRQQHLDTLVLVVADVCANFRASHRLRFWRPARPWWEYARR